MLKFLRESIKEFDHVVWPTRAETKKYLSIVLSVITALTILLFVLGSAFTTSLFALRDAIVPVQTPTTTTSSSKSPIDLSKIKVSTGSTVSGSTATGSVKTLSGVSASGATK